MVILQNFSNILNFTANLFEQFRILLYSFERTQSLSAVDGLSIAHTYILTKTKKSTKHITSNTISAFLNVRPSGLEPLALSLEG